MRKSFFFFFFPPRAQSSDVHLLPSQSPFLNALFQFIEYSRVPWWLGRLRISIVTAVAQVAVEQVSSLARGTSTRCVNKKKSLLQIQVLFFFFSFLSLDSVSNLCIQTVTSACAIAIYIFLNNMNSMWKFLS